jgi:DNA sulfur modification protein DndB
MRRGRDRLVDDGRPKDSGVKVSQRFEEDEGKRGGKENYFDLIDYAKIAVENWELFEPILSYEKTGGSQNPLDERRQ